MDEREGQLAVILGRQLGLVTRRQLLRCGYTDGIIRRRLRSGRLFCVRPGVYSVLPVDALSHDALTLAAVLAAGGITAAGLDTAARKWGIWNRRVDEISLTSSTARRAPSGTRLLRTRHLDESDLHVVDDVRVTGLARTICDMSARTTAHGLVNMMHEAEFTHRLRVEDVRAEAMRLRGRPGMARVLRALDLHAAGGGGAATESEIRFLELVELAGLPEPLVGHWVRGLDTRYRLDTYWRRQRWNCEVDGGPHSRKGTQVRDTERDADLRAGGTRIDRFPTAIIWADPGWVVRQLQRAWTEVCAART